MAGTATGCSSRCLRSWLTLYSELEKLHAQQPQLFPPGLPIAEQAVLVVGYSSARQRFIGRAFDQVEASAGFVQSDPGQRYVAPWDEELAGLQPDTDASMIKLARAQVRLFRRKRPEIAVGGRLICAHLSQRGRSMSIEALGDLDAR